METKLTEDQVTQIHHEIRWALDLNVHDPITIVSATDRGDSIEIEALVGTRHVNVLISDKGIEVLI